MTAAATWTTWLPDTVERHARKGPRIRRGYPPDRGRAGLGGCPCRGTCTLFGSPPGARPAAHRPRHERRPGRGSRRVGPYSGCLTGTGSTAGASYQWTQVLTGPTDPDKVTLSGATTLNPNFSLPLYAFPQTNNPRTFRLTVTAAGVVKTDDVLVTPVYRPGRDHHREVEVRRLPGRRNRQPGRDHRHRAPGEPELSGSG